jgi:hypothetical protein
MPTLLFISFLKRADVDRLFAYLRLSYHPPLDFESLHLVTLKEAYVDERGALMGGAPCQPPMQRDISSVNLLRLLILQQRLLRIIRRLLMDLQNPLVRLERQRKRAISISLLVSIIPRRILSNFPKSMIA